MKAVITKLTLQAEPEFGYMQCVIIGRSQLWLTRYFGDVFFFIEFCKVTAYCETLFGTNEWYRDSRDRDKRS